MPSHILIVEDDRFLRELMTQKLAKENFKITEAVDGEEGVKKAKEVKPDLVLLDLILPGIDGFEVLSRIKSDPDETVNKVPVIILSNLGQKEDIDRGMELGAIDFLIKAQFTPGEIIQKVRTILN